MGTGENFFQKSERLCLQTESAFALVCGMKSITATQLTALRIFADGGNYVGKLQSNHYLNGITGCVKRGLISRKYAGMYVQETITESGLALLRSN
jgi:hypothetical protein